MLSSRCPDRLCGLRAALPPLPDVPGCARRAVAPARAGAVPARRLVPARGQREDEGVPRLHLGHAQVPAQQE